MKYVPSRLIVFFLIGFSLASCAQKGTMPGRAFEGTITQVIRMPGLSRMIQNGMDSAKAQGGDGQVNPLLGALGLANAITLKMYVRENKVAYEMSALGGMIKFRSIIDRTTRTLTVLSPNHQAIVTDLHAMDTLSERVSDSMQVHPERLDSLRLAVPKPTGKTQTINGFEAEEYRSTVAGMDIDMWLTSDPRMKFYDVVRDAILGRRRTGSGGMEELFQILSPISGSGKVAVKADVTMQGQPFMSSELKEIEEGKVDDERFEIPKGYEIIKSDSIRRRPVETEQKM